MTTLLELIDATIAAVEEMKRDGVTHVAVAPETLAALREPVGSADVAASAPPGQEPHTGRDGSPSRPSSGTGTRGENGPLGERALPAAERTEGRPDSSAMTPPAADTAAWSELRTTALACTKCRALAQSRHHVVFGAGDQRAELLFIGEAPGRDEDLKGEPFVGRAGELLTKIIQAMGLQRHEVYIANVLKCRPPENRVPEPEEVSNCRPYLERQIELIQPKVIVALGATALRALLDVHLGITKMRGTWYTYRGIPIMPTFHPAYLLRNPAAKREVWQDMQAVVKKLGRELPRK